MKRNISITIMLVCIVLLASCINQPKQEPEPEVTQLYVYNNNAEATSGLYSAVSGDTRMVLRMPAIGNTCTLDVYSKSLLTGEWPEDPVTYTGTFTEQKYDKTISETETRKEVTGTYCYTMTFTEVSDPAYSSMVHSYDGTFDMTYVSGYGIVEGSPRASNGGIDLYGQDGTVLKFDVTLQNSGAASPLIGMGYWTIDR